MENTDYVTMDEIDPLLLDLPDDHFLWKVDSNRHNIVYYEDGGWESIREYWEWGLVLHCECDPNGYRNWQWGKPGDFEEI